MLKAFYPKRIADSAYSIDYKKLYEEGCRGIIFDIDNTLVEHGADADRRAIELINMLKKIGFDICLISNNKEERVARFNRELNVKYIHDAGKPARKNFIKAMKMMGTATNNTVFVGDQLFTDIFGANRVGILTYFVKPIGPEIEIQIKLKRKLERVILHCYRKHIKSGRIPKY